MSNKLHGFTAEADRAKYGLNNSTHGRVTLYCNPHDQVISSTTVQGIGWRGLNDTEITATFGDGVFTQRVFAQGFAVGKQGQYDYWRHHHLSTAEKPLKPGSLDFWQPNSPYAKYSVAKGLEADQGWGRILSWPMTVLSAPLIIIALKVAKTRINALPPENWKLPLRAPDLPESFPPESVRFGIASKQFDQDYDAPGEYRNKDRIHERMLAQDDPYTGSRTTKDGKRTDIPQGNERSEAGLQQEHHAYLRMQAKREGRYKNDQKVEAEDKPDPANVDYNEWRSKKLKTLMADTIDTHATDHSTIMTNPMHAERALAYDVAIGNCDIREEDLHQIRIAADWRFVGGLEPSDPNKMFFEYFDTGKLKKLSAYDWAHAEFPMPDTITDEREWAPASKWEGIA